jgi:hypothetical protein
VITLFTMFLLKSESKLVVYMYYPTEPGRIKNRLSETAHQVISTTQLMTNLPQTEPGTMKNRLAETARLVIRTRKIMTNLQQLKAAAAAQQEDEAKDDDTLSMKSYGSHTHYPILNSKTKAKKTVHHPPVKVINPDPDGTEEDENFDLDKDDEDEEWEEGDGEDDDLIEEMPLPRRSIHSAQKPEEEEESPVDCMPPDFYERFPFFTLEGTPFGRLWGSIRLKTFRLIENKYFETAVITMILLSSLALVS